MPRKAIKPIPTESKIGHISVAPAGPQKRRTYDKRDIPDFSPKKDRVCILTGASGYLGTEFIKRFSPDYQIVAVRNHRELQPLPNLVDPLYASFAIDNPPPFEIKADLTKQDDIANIVSTTLKEFGKIDVLINAACYRQWMKLTLDNQSLDYIEWSFAVNTIAPIRLTTECALQFWSSQTYEDNVAANRNVINISSTSGTYVYPDLGQTVYSSTKAALNHASFHMASEMWDIGIRVNTVAPNTFPSYIPTEHVLETILAMDKSDETGQHILME